MWLLAWLASWCIRLYRYFVKSESDTPPVLGTDDVLRDEQSYLHEHASLQTDGEEDDQPTGPAPLLTDAEREALGAEMPPGADLALEMAYLQETGKASSEVQPSHDVDARLRALFQLYGKEGGDECDTA